MASLLKTLLRRRRAAKAQFKAAKNRALAEVKAQAKAQKRQALLLAKQEKMLIKSEEKGLKRRRKHQQKMVKDELAKLKAGRLNASTINRFAGAARAAAPLLMPLLYRSIVAGSEAIEKQKARNAGVSTEQLASFSGHGASLKARTTGLRDSLDRASSLLPAGFIRDVKDRLTDVEAAIDSAEFMTREQRRRAHSTISAEINAVSQQIQDKLQ